MGLERPGRWATAGASASTRPWTSTAAYGLFWFLGSAVLGILYDVSWPALIAFAVTAELAAVPFFFLAGDGRRQAAARDNPSNH